MSQKNYKLIFGLVTILLVNLARFSSAVAASEFQLQPITTTTLCTAALNNCAAAGSYDPKVWK